MRDLAPQPQSVNSADPNQGMYEVAVMQDEAGVDQQASDAELIACVSAESAGRAGGARRIESSKSPLA